MKLKKEEFFKLVDILIKFESKKEKEMLYKHLNYLLNPKTNRTKYEPLHERK